MKSPAVTIGVSQFKVHRGDPEKNLSKIQRFAEKAAGAGAKLLCLPEMATTGFDWERNRALLAEADSHRDAIAGLARKYEVQICGSILERTEAGRAANTLFYFGRDGLLLGSYRKTHLFSLFGEDQHVERGDQFTVLDTEIGRVALGICYDLRFPELFRKNTELGATIQILPAAFPHPRLEHWRTLTKARAIENQCYFIAINQTGVEGHGGDVGTTHYFGHSMVVDPWGEVGAEAREEEELFFVEIDPQLPAKVREKFPALRDRRPEMFE